MKKGFTLIELVIVIGILAVLAAVVVLVLNPAQLLAQARDSQRLSDLGSVKSAIALYLATASSPTFASAGPTAQASSTSICFTTPTLTTSTAVDGTGWVKIALTGTTGGSALGALPTDPTNSSAYQYFYKGDTTNLTYELDGVLESAKYLGLMTSDGGNQNGCYETGTVLTL